MLTEDRFLSGILAKPSYGVKEFDARDLGQGVESFVFAKVPCEDVARCNELENAGFRLVDTNVQLSRSDADPLMKAVAADGAFIRFANPQDQSDVESVAASSFVYTRFHLDPMVPNEVANEIKRLWAGNYFHGKRGNWMVVAESGGRVVGFLQLLSSDDKLIIDLIAVQQAQQGRGIAGAMIGFAAEHCGGWKRMIVGTQIANARSMRTYEKLGFRVDQAQYVFHYHGPATASA